MVPNRRGDPDQVAPRRISKPAAQQRTFDSTATAIDLEAARRDRTKYFNVGRLFTNRSPRRNHKEPHRWIRGAALSAPFQEPLILVGIVRLSIG